MLVYGGFTLFLLGLSQSYYLSPKLWPDWFPRSHKNSWFPYVKQLLFKSVHVTVDINEYWTISESYYLISKTLNETFITKLNRDSYPKESQINMFQQNINATNYVTNILNKSILLSSPYGMIKSPAHCHQVFIKNIGRSKKHCHYGQSFVITVHHLFGINVTFLHFATSNAYYPCMRPNISILDYMKKFRTWADSQVFSPTAFSLQLRSYFCGPHSQWPDSCILDTDPQQIMMFSGTIPEFAFYSEGNIMVITMKEEMDAWQIPLKLHMIYQVIDRDTAVTMPPVYMKDFYMSHITPYPVYLKPVIQIMDSASAILHVCVRVSRINKVQLQMHINESVMQSEMEIMMFDGPGERSPILKATDESQTVQCSTFQCYILAKIGNDIKFGDMVTLTYEATPSDFIQEITILPNATQPYILSLPNASKINEHSTQQVYVISSAYNTSLTINRIVHEPYGLSNVYNVLDCMYGGTSISEETNQGIETVLSICGIPVSIHFEIVPIKLPYTSMYPVVYVTAYTYENYNSVPIVLQINTSKCVGMLLNPWSKPTDLLNSLSKLPKHHVYAKSSYNTPYKLEVNIHYALNTCIIAQIIYPVYKPCELLQDSLEGIMSLKYIVNFFTYNGSIYRHYAFFNFSHVSYHPISILNPTSILDKEVISFSNKHIDDYVSRFSYVGNISLVFDLRRFWESSTAYLDLYLPQSMTAIIIEISPDQSCPHTETCHRVVGVPCDICEDQVMFFHEGKVDLLSSTGDLTTDHINLRKNVLTSRGYSKVLFKFIGQGCHSIQHGLSIITLTISQSYVRSEITFRLTEKSEFVIDMSNYPCHYEVKHDFRGQKIKSLKACSLVIVLERVIPYSHRNLECHDLVDSVNMEHHSNLSVTRHFNFHMTCAKKAKYSTFTTWNKAHLFCQRRGKYLLSVHSETEMTNIIGIVQPHSVPIAIGIYIGLKFEVSLVNDELFSISI